MHSTIWVAVLAVLSVSTVATAQEPPVVIKITPRTSLVDEPISIRISGLRPGEEVKVNAELVGYGRADWQSSAIFRANSDGVVDPDYQAPLTGSYDTVDGMGLFWSMTRKEPVASEDEEASQFIGAVEPGKAMPLNIWVEAAGRPTVFETAERLFVSDDVQRIEIREEGLVGTLFVPPGSKPRPAVIVPHGGFCGFPPEQLAAALAAKGFVSFAIQYCGAEGQPKDLSSENPLEYFEKAILWLQHHPDIAADRIGIIGMSTGGVVALLVAATFPEISAVVSVKSGGLNSFNFTYRGEPVGSLPAMPLTDRVRAEILEAQPEKCKPGGAEQDWSCFDQSMIFITRLALHGFKDPGSISSGVIPVERINGPILLVSGMGDKALPSTLLFEIILERLERHNFSHPVEHVAYPGAGHRLGIPHLPRTEGQFGYLLLGGNAKDAAAANLAFWPHTIEFLRRHLGPTSELGKKDISALDTPN